MKSVFQNRFLLPHRVNHHPPTRLIQRSDHVSKNNNNDVLVDLFFMPLPSESDLSAEALTLTTDADTQAMIPNTLNSIHPSLIFILIGRH